MFKATELQVCVSRLMMPAVLHDKPQVHGDTNIFRIHSLERVNAAVFLTVVRTVAQEPQRSNIQTLKLLRRVWPFARKGVFCISRTMSTMW